MIGKINESLRILMNKYTFIFILISLNISFHFGDVHYFQLILVVRTIYLYFE